MSTPVEHNPPAAGAVGAAIPAAESRRKSVAKFLMRIRIPAPEKKPPPDDSTDYRFETYAPFLGRAKRHSTMRTREAAAHDVGAFARRLGIDMNGSIGILRDEIERFVIHHNLNIDWYQRKLTKETFKRWLFFVISLGLLLIIPLGIAFTPGLVHNSALLAGIDSKLADKLSGTSTILTAQISAVLTGFFAFYRALSAYFDKRELVGIWSRTLAALKQQLYSFEQSWEKRYIGIENREEFSRSLREATGKARAIVIDEQRQYYENLSYPNLDLGAMLKNAAADSAATLSPALTAAKDAAKRETDLAQLTAQLDARIVTLTALVSQHTADLQKATTPDAELKIRTLLVKSRADLRAAEMDRAVVARTQATGL